MTINYSSKDLVLFSNNSQPCAINDAKILESVNIPVLFSYCKRIALKNILDYDSFTVTFNSDIFFLHPSLYHQQNPCTFSTEEKRNHYHSA